MHGDVAAVIAPIADKSSTRIQNLSTPDAAEYVRILAGAVRLTLMKWNLEGEPPDPEAIYQSVCNIG